MEPEELLKMAPAFPELDNMDELVKFGKVFSFLTSPIEMYLVQPTDIRQIFDFDNIVVSESREVIGYIFDVIG